MLHLHPQHWIYFFRSLTHESRFVDYMFMLFNPAVLLLLQIFEIKNKARFIPEMTFTLLSKSEGQLFKRDKSDISFHRTEQNHHLLRCMTLIGQ